MVFENYRKSLILQHCERSELRLHKKPKMVNLAIFEKLKLEVKQCYQTEKIVGKCHNWKSSHETFLVIFKQHARFIRGQNRVIFQGGNF